MDIVFLFRTNPLGSGGEVAEAFFILCRAMWVERFKQVAPRELKVMIAHVAPYFTGSQQHDSQEFLMYFLDGLHEDLNRVRRCSCVTQLDRVLVVMYFTVPEGCMYSTCGGSSKELCLQTF